MLILLSLEVISLRISYTSLERLTLVVMEVEYFAVEVVTLASQNNYPFVYF